MNRAGACLAALAACLVAGRDARAAGRPRVTVYDDGVKVMRDARVELEASPWPAGAIDLFALRGETVALQVVVEAGDTPVDDARVIVEPFVVKGPDGAALGARVDRFVERFVVVERPSGNDNEPGSLAFTERAAPRASFVGALADPLIPVELATSRAEAHERAAVWIDVTIPDDARAGVYTSALLVRDARRELASRAVVLRVLPATLPYAAAPVFVYYDTRELIRRMGDARAEPDLRALFHAHHLSAIHDLNDVTLGDARTLDLDRRALTGASYTPAAGYEGAGEGRGEGILALGAYGSLGEPSRASLEAASRLRRALTDSESVRTPAFLYTVDEDCSSSWPARWLALLKSDPSLRGTRAGATCGDDPVAQAADLVMQNSSQYDPARARLATATRDAWVWAYNGRRPSAGAMMLDLPATDLRANAWIAMRYGVPRWFYWESTFWFDGNRGGQGGERGFDPFVTAETFHNADGDHANGDGLLVYPGTQGAGMTDLGVATVFPSVRLKNLRRGVEDAGYVLLARSADSERADEIVRRAIPRALAFAGERAAFSERGRDWLEARRRLAVLVANAGLSGHGHDRGPNGDDGAVSEPVSEGCGISTSSIGVTSASGWSALLMMSILTFGLRLRARRQRGHAHACIESNVCEASEVSTSHADQTRASD